MARSVSPQPVIPMPRAPKMSSSSPLEDLVLSKEQPKWMVLRLCHPHYLYLNYTPADRLMSLLPRASVVTLRAVSHTMKEWVHDHHPDLLTNLRVTCPLPRFSLYSSGSTLRHLALGCRQLTIDVLPSASPPLEPSPAGQIFQIFKHLKSLRIKAPLTEAFHPLLSLRVALESASPEALTEIHIEQLTIPGLLALRWGGFDAFMGSGWITERFWRRITSLRIGMTSDWLKCAHRDSDDRNDKETKAKLKEKRDVYRQSIQIMHNWFFQFSLNGNLDRICFEWVDAIGPNPLLLDEEVTKDGGCGWFSAPEITWKGVKEVWLGGVCIDISDVMALNRRLLGLEKLLVWDELAENSITGNVMGIDGRDWLDINLLEYVQDSLELVGTEQVGDDGVESMLCPFVLRL